MRTPTYYAGDYMNTPRGPAPLDPHKGDLKFKI